MRFVKRKQKVLAVFFLLIILNSVLQPVATYALTTGPHQPEYTSYEQPGASDMVNLMTGDFTFSLPILEVPGPEGSFSVPLTYNAGIGLEQESSWLGLGWTLNVGAITRQINQYPDDASGENQLIGNTNLHGVRGWTSAALGLGTMGWNNVQGSYGVISLLGIVQVEYDRNGISSGAILGIGAGNGAITFDPIQFASGVETIASFGAAAAVEGAAELSVSAIAKQTAVSIVAGTALSAAFPSKTPNINPSAAYWSYNKKTEQQGLFHKDYWIWLDDTRQENMYGILNLDKAPQNTSTAQNSDLLKINGGPAITPNAYWYSEAAGGSTSDINYYLPPGVAYKDAPSSCLLATDNFSVKAPGIAGNIQPYRLDVGSVSMPLIVSPYHIRYDVLPYASYKVPFIYAGTQSSSYLYNTGGAGTNFNFGLNLTNFYLQATPGGPSVDIGTFTLDDVSFGPQRVRTDVAGSYKIPQANHVEWLSNSEVMNATTFSNGFMDYFTTTSNPTRKDFRSTYPFNGTTTFASTSSVIPADGKYSVSSSAILSFKVGNAVQLNIVAYNTLQDMQGQQNPIYLSPQYAKVTNIDLSNSKVQVTMPTSISPYIGKYANIQIVILDTPKQGGSIAGYSITGVNGLTYHFALPSYDYGYYTLIADKTSPTSQYSSVRRPDGFANTWLLTGITGPDFVDRNANGAIDETDWGYWVKFNYGNYADHYHWKIPYSGNTVDSENSSLTSSEGYKQLYYLNSIETRTHVAIFIKDYRKDNMDAGLLTTTLKLSEIALLKREDYKKLFTVYSQVNDAGTINTVWLAGSFYPSGVSNAMGDFIIQNSLRRIKFTHNYNLCLGTPNSTDANGGKLTLARVSILGRSGTQVVPDYKFDYGANPSYNSNLWDAWGLYNAAGTSAYNTHAASSVDSDGSSWSLSRVTTPQGSTVEINYERDKYSSASGIDNLGVATPNFNFSTYAAGTSGLDLVSNVPSASNFAVGDIVQVAGWVSGTCAGAPFNPALQPISAKISSIQTNPDLTKNIRLDANFGFFNCGSSPIPVTYTCTLSKARIPINGDGIRVGSIVLRDQNQTYKTRYLYSNDDGTSSGVIAQEPGYARTSSFDFNTLPGYPVTPIIYGKVSVLSGSLSTDLDYFTRYVYEFETPNTSMVTLNSDRIQFNGFVNAPNSTSTMLSLKNQITDITSKIGSLKSIKVYDKTNNIISSTAMGYTSQLLNPGGVNNYQGYYSSSVLMHDKFPLTTVVNNVEPSIYKINRSTIIKYPYSLQSVVTQKDGATTRTDNIAWDFISGQVIETNSTSALGLKTKTVTQPAYSVANGLYAQMGPKAINVANKNMLGQSAAQYVYRLDGSGNITTLISGQATTWNNVWSNYRDFDASTGTIIEGSGTPQTSIWRKSKTYVYNGTYADIQNDGALRFNPSNQFDFTANAANANWKQTSEVTRYDHFSLPLEMKDPFSNLYSSTKTDFSGKLVLASAANASYTEFAYSGAEDGDNTSIYFGGEVARKNGSVVASPKHTGSSSLSLTAGAYGFVFKSTGLLSKRSYRASVWTSDPTNGKIYYNNGTEVLPTPVVSQAITLPGGTWYRLDITIPSGNTSIEVGVKSTSGSVYFDDFRFQPFDAAVSCNVYNPSTLNLEYVLDNSNVYTRYEYNTAGNLIKTYIESMKPGQIGEKLISESKYDYKRFHVDQ